MALPSSNIALPCRSPRLRILANGSELNGVIDAEVISNNYYAADRFNASLAVTADPSTGISFWAAASDICLDIQFSLDNGSTFTSLIQGPVDSVVIDAVSGLAHLNGRDLSAVLIEARTQETFANRTASEIATLLAERHNLLPQVSPTTTPVGRYYQSQHDRITLDQFSHATTEWDLLVFLAQQEGFDVFAQGTSLYFQPAIQQTSRPTLLCPTDLTGLRLERSLTLARDIEVSVKSWNSYQNSAFIECAYATMISNDGITGLTGSAQRYIFVQPNLTSDGARKLAQRKLAELTQHERMLELTMPGELTLTPRNMIALGGTGSDFDQSYYIDSIERRIRYDGGFVQRIRAKNSSPRTDSTMPPTSILA